MNLSDWIAILEILVAIIGIIVGCIGGKQLQEANRLKLQIKELKNQIEKIEINNSQVAQIINNSGMGYKDTKELAEDIVKDATKYKPDIIISKEEPQNLENGGFWLREID